MFDSFPCPKCSRRLIRSGEVSIGDETFPVFQCDECLATVDLFETTIEVALTFAVGADGVAFDPVED